MNLKSPTPPALDRPPLLPLGAAMLAGAMLGPVTAAAHEQTLSTVNVRADAEYQPDGYRATSTRVGKVLQDPHDVPQAVTTITRNLMDEEQVGSLKDALRNVSGLTFNAAEGGRAGDNMNLRGFYTFGDMYLDGIRDTAQYNRETFNLEQVDVLRGAGAMLFGRGQAGGVINMVTKTPLPVDRNKLTTSIGTDNHREITADLNKKFSADTQLRINLMNRDEGSWRSNPANGDEAEIHRQGFASSLALNQNSDNRFWVNYQYIRTRDTPDYGVSFNSTTHRPQTTFDANTYWGSKRTFDDSDTQMLTLVNEYQFSDDTQLRTQLRRAVYDRTYWAKTPSSTTAPTATSSIGGNVVRATKYDTLTLQSDLTTKFSLAGMKHEFLAGMEYLKEDSFRANLRSASGFYFPWDVDTATAPNRFHSKSYALYLQDTVEFIPQWKATLGLRRDEMDASYTSANSPKLTYGEWSTRAALSYHPADDTHYYLAHSDSFSPTADLYQLTTTPFPAERSQVAELGAKWMLFDGKLAFSAALYSATKEWERNTDLESTSAILTKKRRTNGVEFELAGRVTDKWEVFAGLSLMDPKIIEKAPDLTVTPRRAPPGATCTTVAPCPINPNLVGQTARNTAKITSNLWTTYRIDGAWKVGGGFEFKDKRYAYDPSSDITTNAFNPNVAPSYIRWDGMLSYEQKSYTVRLNIQNLFDKLYYDAIYDNGSFTVPGQRRKAILTTEFRF